VLVQHPSGIGDVVEVSHLPVSALQVEVWHGLSDIQGPGQADGNELSFRS
jgi:hypothetical protein